jgi:hypothetical protein
MGELVAFLGVAALVIITPGPDTAVTIRIKRFRKTRPEPYAREASRAVP